MINNGDILRSFLAVALILLLTSCSRIDTSWHKYKERNFEVVGKSAKFVMVVSDGWKIINKTDKEHDLYEWGWEITVKSVSDPTLKDMKTADSRPLIPVIVINEIRYTLLDKDGFELVTDKMISKRNAMIAQEFNKTETYRQTATIPKSKALRAANSSYLVIVD